MSTSNPNVRVGVAALVRGPDGRVVFGRRKGSHGAGKWAFPGGHLEYGESFIDCAERETLEETGLKVKGLEVVDITNDIFEDLGKHYVTIFVVCKMTDPQQEPQVMEPDKCEGWAWFSFDEIKQLQPEGLFLPVQNLLKQWPNWEAAFQSGSSK
ncbi:hypothetical protein N0V93_002083 [Gnomoniopsis smithogilvyi]|uniref:Nudix hydrolase domain-containing protein n=1 Tax=Gnomoniopsis smithogilvyi TaxID=1191159 RepID=A0A9W8Z4T3_9PEZI|nr:hypothetical protein N0V93_002083 [Gnomoniopsis smithogilvyi]